MSPAPASSSPAGAGTGADAGGGEDKTKDAAIAKTAGFVVFSGIAVSIIKALIPKPSHPPPPSPPPPSALPSRPPPPQRLLVEELSSKDPMVANKLKPEAVAGSGLSSGRTIMIVKGDTLWGLSRKYGVTIDALKKANEIIGDKIYAGKKLQMPTEP